MKNWCFCCLFFITALKLRAQSTYDSITISRFLITDELLGKNWKDTLKAGHYGNYLGDQKTIWKRSTPLSSGVKGATTAVLALTDRIKRNGTADVAKCFIPRHSINYYYQGKIVRFLQVCFECDGLRFSDNGPFPFIKSISTREKQMAELKELFKPVDKQLGSHKLPVYDSITISKIKGGWNMLEPGKNELVGERSVWKRSQAQAAGQPAIAALTDSIKINGTGPIGRCFFPRHRVNYYKDGMVELYLLVCFECNELQFSDDKFPEMFVKDRPTRMKQMDELRVVFRDFLEKN